MSGKRLRISFYKTIIPIFIGILIISSIVAATTVSSSPTAQCDNHQTQNSTDTDGDGLSDCKEILVYNSNPNKADTDGDGIPDQKEIARGLNPRRSDSDGDGSSDANELNSGTNPLMPNNTSSTDGDNTSEKGGLLDWLPPSIGVFFILFILVGISFIWHRNHS